MLPKGPEALPLDFFLVFLAIFGGVHAVHANIRGHELLLLMVLELLLLGSHLLQSGHIDHAKRRLTGGCIDRLDVVAVWSCGGGQLMWDRCAWVQWHLRIHECEIYLLI